MKCVYCQKEIENYIIVKFNVLTEYPEPEVYGAWGYSVAMLECPHCDMIFFLKADSKRLQDMKPLTDRELHSSFTKGVKDISLMTREEKEEIYQRTKKILLEKYT